MQDIIADLKWRGLVYQTTDDENLANWLLEKPRTLYAGFDPTADSLHIGSLMPLLLLRRFQKAGHKPIAVAGGATGMIGDPSGKSAERNLQTVEALEKNLAGIEKQMRAFLDFDCGETSALLVNNLDWTQPFSYIDFLRDVGKHFPVNVMMTKDSVKSRLDSESGLSYTEFSYMLLQAFDFAHLQQAHHCELQVGGRDQWGNITAGVELSRRMHSAKVFGLTCPLLTKADGTKMGKTESGTVWLDSNKTSPYEFYQYWINVADEDAGKCLRFLTELDREEIEALDQSRESEPHLRASQKKLAEHMTQLVHATDGLNRATTATEFLFKVNLENVSSEQLSNIYDDVPGETFERAEFDGEGLSVVDAFQRCQLGDSKGEVRRGIKQGGYYINNQKVESDAATIKRDDLIGESMVVLRKGKKKYALLKASKS